VTVICVPAAATSSAAVMFSDEDKIITIQGKEFEYEDILLFKREGKSIIVLFNDTEQIKKFVNKEDNPPYCCTSIYRRNI